jgi:type IV secretion system protein VirB6
MSAFMAPIGAFLTQFDTAINTAQTAAVSGLVTAVKAPIAAMGAIYFAIVGWRVAAGDMERLNAFTFDMVKIGLIFFVAANLTTFNTWVVGVFEHGFPEAISTAVMGGTGTGQVGTVSGVGAAIDHLWANMWVRAGTVWKEAPLTDFSSPVIAGISVLVGGIGLVLIAGVYLIARFLFAIVIVLGPVAIACAMFSPTRPIFERWIGKGVSMIILQVAAVITLQIVLTGTNTFLSMPDTAGDLPTQIQNLISMVVWVAMSAFAVYSLPTLAYSIGTGVAISFAPIVAAATAAVSAAVGIPSMGAAQSSPIGGSGAGGAGLGSAPDVNLSLNRAEIAGPSATSTGYSEASAPPLLLPPPTPLLTYDGG